MIWYHLVVDVGTAAKLNKLLHTTQKSESSSWSDPCLCFPSDTSRRISTTGTDQNPQTEGLLLPEGDERHVGGVGGERGAAEQDAWERSGHAQQQQQPTSDEPQTVTLVKTSFRY